MRFGIGNVTPRLPNAFLAFIVCCSLLVAIVTACASPLSSGSATQSPSSTPQTAQDHYAKGLALKKAGDKRGALREFQAAIQAAPQSAAGAHFMAGVTHYELGEHTDAAKALQLAVNTKTPNSEIDEAIARSYLASALDQQGDKQGALKERLAAVRLKPDDSALHFNLGSLYEELGDIEHARQSFERAAQLNSQDPDTLSRLGDLYATQGDTDKAIETLQRALKLYTAEPATNPGEAFARTRLGEILAKRSPTGRGRGEPMPVKPLVPKL